MKVEHNISKLFQNSFVVLSEKCLGNFPFLSLVPYYNKTMYPSPSLHPSAEDGLFSLTIAHTIIHCGGII